MVESHARSSRNRLSPGPLNRPSIETPENDTSRRIKATLRVPCRLLLGKRLDGFVDFVVSHEPVDTPANAPVLGDQNRHRELNQSSTFVSSCIVTKHNWIVHGLRRPANLKLLFLNEISASDELCVQVFFEYHGRSVTLSLGLSTGWSTEQSPASYFLGFTTYLLVAAEKRRATDRLEPKSLGVPLDSSQKAWARLCTNCARIERFQYVRVTFGRKADSPICWKRC